MILAPRAIEIRHFHLFCGLGGSARGFNHGHARVGHATARFRCIGGVDVDKAAIADFERLARTRGTVLDLFSRDQYIGFHGHEPPSDWREATPADICRAAGGEVPHIAFGSAPCKGFSGLLSEKLSKSTRYQALNQLAFRGLWLALEAWKDDPIEFWLWENVPRIATRGRPVLDQMIRLLEHYGYAVAETTHDCGELGELGQSRKRFLLVARHRDKVPPFLYEPPKRALRSVGDVIGRLPVPGPHPVLPMHRLPSLQWQTWVRLAFVEAGSDWRSLNRLRIADGVLRDFRLKPDTEWYRSALGVTRWSEASNTVTSEARPQNGAFSVADPRIDGHDKSVQLGVRPWNEPAPVVTGKMFVGGGPHAVADPRYAADDSWREGRRGLGVLRFDAPGGTVTSQAGPAQGTFSVADPRPQSDWSGKGKYLVTPFEGSANTVIGASTTGNGAFAVADPRLGEPRFNHVYRVVPWSESTPAIAGGGGPAGGLAVADPRTGYGDGTHNNVLRVTPWDQASKTITAGDHPSGGALCVADPRPEALKDGKKAYHTSGEYGVVPWNESTGAVTATGQHDNGRWSVADPRNPDDGEALLSLPAATDRLVAFIRAIDNTFHRPFTTLELAALQSLFDPDEVLELYGSSDSAWRERIGNAVPSAAAAAIASVMAEALLLAWSGETFQLNASPIWVRPLAIAISVRPFGEAVS